MSRLLLITPAHNEAAHLDRTIDAVAAQTHPPARWLIVDDCSTDETPRILDRRAAELPFLEVRRAASHDEKAGADRLTVAAEARAFNAALASTDLAEFTHIGKLDADIELPGDYFECLLERFAANRRLGVAGGVLLEENGRGWQRTRIPDYHVRGALKLYSRACFDEIGGIEERLGWDTIDETYARMLDYETRSFPDIRAKHHRPVGSANGALRGRARHGQCAYILRYGTLWALARSFKVATEKPYGLAGVAFLYGYLRSVARRDSKVEDRRFKRFVRRELRGRVMRTSSVFHPSGAN